MPNPQQPAQPQQPQQAGAVGFNPGALLQLLNDLQQSAPVVAPVLLKLFVDVANVFKGQQPVMQAAAPVTCGPGGDKDKNHCCDCLVEDLARSLATAVHLRCWV